MRRIKYLLGLVAVLAATVVAVAQPTAPTTLSQVTGVNGFSLGDTYATFSFTGTDNKALAGYNIYRDGALVDFVDIKKWTWDQKLAAQPARRGYINPFCRFDYFGAQAGECGFPVNLYYTAQDLEAETTYAFTVKSLDTLENESAASAALSVTTLPADNLYRLRSQDTWITGDASRALNFSEEYYVRVLTRDGFDSWHAQRRPFVKFSIPDTITEVKSATFRSYITTIQRPDDRSNPSPPVNQAVFLFPVSAEWDERTVTFDNNPMEDIGYDPQDGQGINAITNIDSIGGYDQALTSILFPSSAYGTYTVAELNFTAYVNEKLAEGIYEFAFSLLDSADGSYRNDLYQWYSADAPAFQSHFEIELEAEVITANHKLIDNQFKVYPNPAINKTVTMEMRQAGTYEITLIDLQGRSSLRTIQEGYKFELDLMGVGKGLYVLKTRNIKTGEISSPRIMVE